MAPRLVWREKRVGARGLAAVALAAEAEVPRVMTLLMGYCQDVGVDFRCSGQGARGRGLPAQRRRKNPLGANLGLQGGKSWGRIAALKTSVINLMSDNIESQVKDIIVEQLGVEPEKVTLEAKFIEDLGADSLDIVELIMAFEEKFSIEVPEEASEGLKTVQDVIDFINKSKA